jgi:DNA mismatch repair protein MutS
MDNPESPEKLTPMLAQYQKIKAKHPDSILLYRMGDFYEMFFQDALTASPVLEVQLTARDKNAPNPIPMCGVPYHAITSYIQKLIANGFKVALCEQMEEATPGKGLVRREVTRIITPSLVPDPELVSDDVCNILLSVFETAAGKFEVAALDLLKSQVKVGTVDAETLIELAIQLAPKEILIPSELRATEWLSDIQKMFSKIVVTERNDYFPAGTPSLISIVALEHYLEETQKTDQLPHLSNPLPLFESESLKLDSTTLASLEVIKSLSPLSDTTSLFHVLDHTVTPMGRRTLKDWLTEPLNNKEKIQERHACVGELLEKLEVATDLRGHLSSIRDLERLTTKTLLGLAMPRDIVAIREILKIIPSIKTRLQELNATALKRIAEQLNALDSLTLTLEEAMLDSPPATLRDGGILKDTYHPLIAEYRTLSKDAKSTIASIELREKERTGIPSLKVKYSKVFGYTIEITKSHLNKIPPEYVRKQTIAGGERFITEELKSFEERVVTSEHKLKTLEESLFIELRKKVAAASEALLINANCLAELDVLNGFAKAARERGYICPQIHGGWDLVIEDGRHPVVEGLLPPGKFVPNSISFTKNECRTWLITGPNMGGKSTIMRQIALIVLMAQAGSFVPARSAKIPLVDAIFTRVGSSDDLAHGRSTFMVEMTEVARILNKATARSLILIDEIGRGTSTYDGLSLAWSILEFMHLNLKSKTLFATHFHELTEIEKKLPQLRNANVLVEKWKSEIVFLHRLASGICNRSYGIEVARLAGLPKEVLTRAKEIVSMLEVHSQKALRARNRALEIHDNQMVFFEEFGPFETRPE